MQITEEEKLLEKRCCDQAALAQKTGKTRFSPFLDPRQAARLLPFFEKRGVLVLPFGGYYGAERQMLAFYTDSEPRKDEFPIGALEITGRDLDGLSHRDFLGSVLGLGFTREKVGDIVADGGRCVVFLSRELCGFAEQNLDKVGRVGVSAKACEMGSLVLGERRFEELCTTVSSPRLDAGLRPFVPHVARKGPGGYWPNAGARELCALRQRGENPFGRRHHFRERRWQGRAFGGRPKQKGALVYHASQILLTFVKEKTANQFLAFLLEELQAG